MNRILCMFLLAGISFFAPGCASIISKKPPVSIITRPKDADITIVNKKGKQVWTGKSPALINLKPGNGYFSKAAYTITLSYAGYEDKKVFLNYGINGWYFGNLLIGGLIGMLIVDPLTGHMWTIKNPIVDETLVKSSATTATNTPLKIMDIREISPEMKAQLVLVK